MARLSPVATDFAAPEVLFRGVPVDPVLTSSASGSGLPGRSDPESVSVALGSGNAAGVTLPAALVSRDGLTLALAGASRAGRSVQSSEPSVDLDARDAGDAPVHFARCTCPVCNGSVRSPLGYSSATATGGTTDGTSAMSMVSLQTLADYLRVGYWQQAGTFTRRYNLASSGTAAKAGVLTYNLTGWANDSDGLSADRQALTREVFKLYSASLGITFREVTGAGGDIRFTDNDTGAYAYMASGWYTNSAQTSVVIDYSVINIASNWYDGRSNYNTYTPQTIFHEVGHALGLGHQGLYNYTGTTLSYANSAQFTNDSWQATMMSYWDQTQNPNTGASFAWLHTPMAVDWIALNDLYRGQGYSTDKAFLGNTTYGVGTNISASVSQIWNQFSTYAGTSAFTLADGGGYDILDVSNFSANQLINLAPSQPGSSAPSISSIGGKTGNLTIAAGTFIEAANGGSGGDIFYGNQVANTFRGNGGNDSFHDSLGSDVYYGDAGSDWLYFSESLDLLSYTLSGSSLLFTRVSGSADVDQVWSGLENLSFNGVATTYDQLVTNLAKTPPPPAPLPPTATLSLTNVVGSAVNEGSSVSIAIATTNVAQGSSLYWRLSGTGISSADFAGLSSLSGSVSTDASGKAALTLSVLADATTEGNELMGFTLFSDSALTSKLADLSLTIQDSSQTPVVTNQTLWGTTGSDVITGGAGNDRLTGVLASGTTASALGTGQIDRLTGQAGADVFVLGDSRGVFYNDRLNGDVGARDYARIIDFRTGEDKLQLRRGVYLPSVANGALTLYWDRNSTGRLETSGSSRDEMVALLEGVSGITGNDIVWL